MTGWLVASAFGLPALVAALVDCRLANPSSRWFVGDNPNERSMHVGVIARNGGIGLLVGTMPVALWAATRGERPYRLAFALGLTLILAAVSFLDDRRGLPAGVRLAVHLGVGAAVVLILGVPLVWLLPSLLAVAWFINLYNFMDGLDGLAGGAAVAGFLGYAILAWSGADREIALVAIAFVGGAVGFLALNWPPARIFLGDVGSTALGLAAATLGLAGMMRGLWPWWYPLAAFPMFVGDASVTLLRRAWRREVLWLAHRSHLYQRAALAGVDKEIIAGLYGGSAMVCAIGAAWSIWLGRSPIAVAWLAVPTTVWIALQVVASRRGRP